MVGARLRVGINLLFLLPEMEGTARHALSLLEELGRLDSSIEYVVFVNRDTPRSQLPTAPNFRVVTLPISARSRWRRYLFEQIALPVVARRHRVSLMHSMNYVAPVLLGRKNVVSIHDLNFLEPQVQMSRLRRLTLRFFVALAANISAQVITLSEYSKAAIVRQYKIDPMRLTVVPCAVSDLDDAAGCTNDTLTLQELGVRKPYILGIGVNNEHKNVQSLLRGFARSSAPASHQLVLVGRRTGPYRELLRLARDLGIADSTRFVGAIEDGVLAVLYRRAIVFVFTSLYEGFGMPPLEAMHYGAPVVCSSYGAVSEVVADAALVVPAKDARAIAAAIERLVQDAGLRRVLRRRGLARAQLFSWPDSARKLAAVYKTVGMSPHDDGYSS